MPKALIGFLLANLAVQLFVACGLLFFPADFTQAAFHMKYRSDTRLMVSALGTAVAISSLLLLLALRWLHAGDQKGGTLAGLFGVWSTLAGGAILLRFHEWGALFDVARGATLLYLSMFSVQRTRRSAAVIKAG